MDKILVHRETGSAYRLKDNQVQQTPLPADFNTGAKDYCLIDLNENEWADLDAFYGDKVLHDRYLYTIQEFEKIIANLLS